MLWSSSSQWWEGGSIFWTKMLASGMITALAMYHHDIPRGNSHEKITTRRTQKYAIAIPNFQIVSQYIVWRYYSERTRPRDSVVYHQQLPSGEKICVISERAALAQQMIRSRGVLASGNKGWMNRILCALGRTHTRTQTHARAHTHTNSDIYVQYIYIYNIHVTYIHTCTHTYTWNIIYSS